MPSNAEKKQMMNQRSKNAIERKRIYGDSQAGGDYGVIKITHTSTGHFFLMVSDHVHEWARQFKNGLEEGICILTPLVPFQKIDPVFSLQIIRCKDGAHMHEVFDRQSVKLEIEHPNKAIYYSINNSLASLSKNQGFRIRAKRAAAEKIQEGQK